MKAPRWSVPTAPTLPWLATKPIGILKPDKTLPEYSNTELAQGLTDEQKQYIFNLVLGARAVTPIQITAIRNDSNVSVPLSIFIRAVITQQMTVPRNSTIIILSPREGSVNTITYKVQTNSSNTTDKDATVNQGDLYYIWQQTVAFNVTFLSTKGAIFSLHDYGGTDSYPAEMTAPVSLFTV